VAPNIAEPRERAAFQAQPSIEIRGSSMMRCSPRPIGHRAVAFGDVRHDAVTAVSRDLRMEPDSTSGCWCRGATIRQTI
jgi:hypothetical protein